MAEEKEVQRILDLPRIMHRTPDPSAEHVGAVNYRQEARTRLFFSSFHLGSGPSQDRCEVDSTAFLSNWLHFEPLLLRCACLG